MKIRTRKTAAESCPWHMIGSAHSQGCRVIFWEAHLPQRASRHSFAIECVPLAKRDADVAASYFRKVLVTVLSHCQTAIGISVFDTLGEFCGS